MAKSRPARSGDLVQLDQLIALINQVSNDAKGKLNSINASKESVSIGDMFGMQMLVNHLGQMGEMSSAVISAANQAIIDLARDVKGP